MYYSGDHEFISNIEDGTNKGKCAQILFRKNGDSYQCNAEWTSALHPPDQFRHWCSALEEGRDCMHMEDN